MSQPDTPTPGPRLTNDLITLTLLTIAATLTTLGAALTWGTGPTFLTLGAWTTLIAILINGTNP